ncbi:hypothetical protein Tco_0085617 [Tanacetum coccineum]
MVPQVKGLSLMMGQLRGKSEYKGYRVHTSGSIPTDEIGNVMRSLDDNELNLIIQELPDTNMNFLDFLRVVDAERARGVARDPNGATIITDPLALDYYRYTLGMPFYEIMIRIGFKGRSLTKFNEVCVKRAVEYKGYRVQSSGKRMKRSGSNVHLVVAVDRPQAPTCFLIAQRTKLNDVSIKRKSEYKGYCVYSSGNEDRLAFIFLPKL